jgi:hypothetical protein
MIAKLMFAAGAGLLLSVSLGSAVPIDRLAADGARADAPILIRHSSSSSSSSSSGSWSSHRSSSAPARSSGSAAPRFSPPPARTFSAPSRSWSGPPAVTRSALRWGGPPARYARRHVPIRFLAPLFVAGYYYYPYRYLTYDAPVCSGLTDNGCQLQWTEVPLEDGEGSAWQCVEYCLQQ